MTTTILSIFVLIIVSLFAVQLISYEIRFHRFKKKIQVGTKLTNTFKTIDDEFDDGHTFNVVIVRKGDTHVKIKFEDNSTYIISIYTLIDEGWTIVEN